MAVDTRNKRASALGIAVATFALVLPHPDGAALTLFDRQQVAFCYAGDLIVRVGEMLDLYASSGASVDSSASSGRVTDLWGSTDVQEFFVFPPTDVDFL